MHSLLASSVLFSFFNHLIGATNVRIRLVKEYIRPCEGDKVLDIGCGPADILEFMPPVDYIGFDASVRYISTAKRRFGTRGRFYCTTINQLTLREENFDIVIAVGVLHHLNDVEALQLFELAYSVLRPHGRLITFDGCYMPGQSAVARFFLGNDRGRFIRDIDGYERLARQYFIHVNYTVHSDLLRIPYSHLILECIK